jgi:hypothetical protein
LAEIACGDFSGHRSFSAGKKRGFCRLRLLVHWLKIACRDFSGHRLFSAGKKRGFCRMPAKNTAGVSSEARRELNTHSTGLIGCLTDRSIRKEL